MVKSLKNSSISNVQDYRSMLAGLVPSNEYLIDTRLLNTTTASVTFNDLGQYAGIYKHLQIVAITRDNRSTTGGNNVRVILNGDSGANYASHRLRGDGSTVTSSSLASATSMNIFASSSANDTANVFAAAAIEILDAYSTTKNKTLRCLQGVPVTTGTPAIEIRSGLWINSSIITSITFTPETTGSFVTGSRFSIYGVTA
jgi:hypothetical protein